MIAVTFVGMMILVATFVRFNNYIVEEDRLSAAVAAAAADVVGAGAMIGSDINLYPVSSDTTAGDRDRDRDRDLTKEEFHRLCQHFLFAVPNYEPSIINRAVSPVIPPADAKYVCAVWMQALELAAAAAIPGDDEDDDDDGKKVRRDLKKIVRKDSCDASASASGKPLPKYEPAQDPNMGPNPFNNMHGDAGLSDTTNYAAPTRHHRTDRIMTIQRRRPCFGTSTPIVNVTQRPLTVLPIGLCCCAIQSRMWIVCNNHRRPQPVRPSRARA